MKKRILSMLLAIVMVVGMMPGFMVEAGAADSNVIAWNDEDGDNVIDANETTYTKLQDAFNAGGYVRMNTDYVPKDEIPVYVYKDVTLDLNYRHISVNKMFTLFKINSGVLTITGSGKIENLYDGSNVIELEDGNAKLIIQNGTIDCFGSGYGVRVDRGTVEIRGGTVKNVKNENGTVDIHDGKVGDVSATNGTVSVYGGTASKVVSENDCKVYIEGGTVGGVDIIGGEAHISGGSVQDEGVQVGYGYLQAKAYISGGTITGIDIDNYGIAEISGGSIGKVSCATAGRCYISGGIFYENPEEYVLAGFRVKNNTTHYQVVSSSPSGFTLTIIVNPVDGGKVVDSWSGADIGGSCLYREHAAISPQAQANEGYEFVNWTEDGTEISTDAKYSIDMNKNRTIMANFRKLPHTHEWKYELDSTSTIKAVCTNKDGNCSNTDGGTVTIAAPTDLTYTGNAIEAVVTNDLVDTTTEVKVVYTAKDGFALTGDKPVNAGAYTATITLGDAEISVEYEIEKASLTIMPKSYTLVIGNAVPDLTASDAYTVEGLMGSDTVNNIELRFVSEPDMSEEGTYTIEVNENTLSVTNGENYDINCSWGELKVVACVHNFTEFYLGTVNAENDSIFAKCSKAGCEFSNGNAIITIAAPTDAVYEDGLWHTAALLKYTDSVAVDSEDIIYSATPIDAGEYTASITYESITASVGYEIKKRELTVKADNRSVNAGESALEYTYTVTGWGDNYDPEDEYAHKLSGITAVCADADLTKAGTYTISISGTPVVKESDGTDVTKNYSFKLESGTLTVTPNTYTVTLNTNGGTINEGNVTSYVYGIGATLPTNVTRDGRTFHGWYEDSGASGTPVAYISATDSGDKTYWAKWTANQYTITFDADGGSAIDAITDYYGTAVTAPANPTKTGYTFAGWDDDIPATMPADDVKLTAQWTVNQYTITFNTDGGSAMDAITQDYGTDVAAPANPTKTGYTFAGWVDEAGQDFVFTETTVMGATDITLTAKWNPAEGTGYTVMHKFEKLDGGYDEQPEEKTGTTGEETEAAAKTVEGFTAKSFQQGTIAADGSAVVEIVYTRNEYTLTFQPDNGEEDSIATVKYGAVITAPADPAKTGHSFVGWGTIPATMPADDMTLTAQWTANRYTITFDTDGGTAIDAITQDYGTAVTAPANPTREGYTFVGWDKEIPAAMPAENVTVKALWEEIPETASVIRLAGDTRYDTAIKAADELKAKLGVGKFSAIIVTTGEEFADALAGSYLAAQKNAPILLVRNRDREMNQVKDYIKANLTSGGTVYLLGGEAAVSKKTETGLDGFQVKRLGGKDRYATNLLILQEAGVTSKDILVSTGKCFADSLSASAVGLPILLVKEQLNADQKEFLKDNTGKIYIIGGKNAVSEKIENQLKEFGSITRLSGETRYETSVLVAETFFADPTMAVIAYGDNFPDGLSGGPLAHAYGAPLLLTREGGEEAAEEYLKAHGIQSGYAMGGTAVLKDKTVKTVFSMSNEDNIAVK